MLKKITLAVLASTMVLSAEGKFDGFRAVAAVGISKTSDKASYTNGLAGNNKISISAKQNKNALAFSLSAIYGQIFSNNFYLGGELSLGKIFAKYNAKDSAGNTFFKSSHGLEISFAPVVGYAVTPTTIIYGSVGVTMQKVPTKVVYTNYDSKSKKTAIKPVFTIGVDSFVSDNVFVRAAVSYVMPIKRTIKVTQTTTKVETTGTFKSSSTRFMIGAGYKF